MKMSVVAMKCLQSRIEHINENMRNDVQTQVQEQLAQTLASMEASMQKQMEYSMQRQIYEVPVQHTTDRANASILTSLIP
ncbi:hypothetical protein F0562_001792 [Nyssa sinensis]|uniref:Uncharacterized protein n=1 Tax=Nyssa sinensis TaxID=561372 RepID=A0A5J5C4A3_9ASTE|nr:hypothetical protein F0562_001792 [Nyssa sinensis]